MSKPPRTELGETRVNSHALLGYLIVVCVFRERNTIAEAPDSVNEFGRYFSAKPAHENLDGVGVPIEILLVQMFHEFGTRNYARLMMHQIRKKPIFQSGELY